MKQLDMFLGQTPFYELGVEYENPLLNKSYSTNVLPPGVGKYDVINLKLRGDTVWSGDIGAGLMRWTESPNYLPGKGLDIIVFRIVKRGVVEIETT